MIEKPNATQTLGLDISPWGIKGVSLRLKHGKPILEKTIHVDIAKEEKLPHNVKPLYTTNQKDVIQDLLNQSLVVTSLKSTEVLVMNI